jgi:hypothetical protein
MMMLPVSLAIVPAQRQADRSRALDSPKVIFLDRPKSVWGSIQDRGTLQHFTKPAWSRPRLAADNYRNHNLA